MVYFCINIIVSYVKAQYKQSLQPIFLNNTFRFETARVFRAALFQGTKNSSTDRPCVDITWV